MRYQLELIINKPREKVIELFLDPENLWKWQYSLVSMEHISGEGREVGAKTLQVHKMGKRESEITETITAHNYPDEFSAMYEAGGVRNLIENFFSEIDDNATKWIFISDFNQSSLMIRMMTKIMPGMFKKQSVEFTNLFKEFVESHDEN